MAKTFAVSDMEKQARDIMGKAFDYSFENDNDWGITERVIIKAFLADWSSERDRDSWTTLAVALERFHTDEEKTKRAYRRLVKDGYLYSKAGSKGKRNYGINFK